MTSDKEAIEIIKHPRYGLSMKHPEEKRGEIYMLGEIFIGAFVPLLAHSGSNLIPPIQYLAFATLLGVPLYLLCSLLWGNVKQLFNKKVILYLLGVTVFVTVIPFLLIFWATPQTSGINTALLMQAEVIFTALFGAFIGEKMSSLRIVAISFILVGNYFVLFDGHSAWNSADLVIFFATAFFPIGNWCAKKAMETVHWSTVLLFRGLVGGLLLLCLAQIFEGISLPDSSLWPFLLLFGLIIFNLPRIFWYLGLSRMDISKTAAIGKMSVGVSVILAYPLLGEVPSSYQILGLLFIGAGLYFILKVTSKQYRVSV